jgi:hypothetical protein
MNDLVLGVLSTSILEIHGEFRFVKCGPGSSVRIYPQGFIYIDVLSAQSFGAFKVSLILSRLSSRCRVRHKFSKPPFLGRYSLINDLYLVAFDSPYNCT